MAPATGDAVTFPYGETVTIQTAATIHDPYSDTDVPSWDVPPTETTVTGVAVEPRPSTEQLEAGRNATVDGYTLYFPSGTAINAQNRVVVRGGTFDVLGDAAVWASPFTGWSPGVVVQVTRTAG